jgi:ribosomal-protein-alanine N-acetyltransferase
MPSAIAPAPDAPINTDRLILRPFVAADAPIVEQHCADREVARTTLAIPHPYPPGAAAEWIASHAARFADGSNPVFAITLRDEAARIPGAGVFPGQLIGAIDLRVKHEHRHAEFGYVIYRPWWNRGYATEATRAILAYGFHTLRLHRIWAHHFSNNPASGRVMLKCGMTPEGTLRQHVCKWGEMLDAVNYGILREEFEAIFVGGQ